MKVEEKRRPRTYKIKDKPYSKAMKRAKGKLAPMVEVWVTQYANGYSVGITYDNKLKTSNNNKTKNNDKGTEA